MARSFVSPTPQPEDYRRRWSDGDNDLPEVLAAGVRTLLVPSTVSLLGHWNWWPSGHGKAAEPTAEPEPAPALCR